MLRANERRFDAPIVLPGPADRIQHVCAEDNAIQFSKVLCSAQRVIEQRSAAQINHVLAWYPLRTLARGNYAENHDAKEREAFSAWLRPEHAFHPLCS